MTSSTDKKQPSKKRRPQPKRGLDTYTKTSLIEGEKIVYSARMHKFSRYWGITVLVIGLLMLSPQFIGAQWEKSGINKRKPAAESASPLKKKTEENVKKAKDTVSEYIHKAHAYWINFLEKLSPGMRKMLYKAMETRQRLVAMLLVAYGGYTLLMSIVRKYTMEHTVTTYKVLKKKGLISVQANEIPLKQIEGARVKQSILDRFLHRGTVLVTGVGMERIEARHIADPEMFHKKINEAMHRYT